MKTIKFIVEIDEQYVHDHSDAQKASERLSQNGDKTSFMSAFVDMIGFSLMEKEIEKGTTEFVVKRDSIIENADSIFSHTVGNLAILASVAKKD